MVVSSQAAARASACKRARSPRQFRERLRPAPFALNPMLARRLAATCIARPTLSRRYAVASARKVAAHKPAAASAVEHHEDPQNVAEPTGSVSSQLSRPSVDRSESIITPIYKSDVANPANLDLVQMLTACEHHCLRFAGLTHLTHADHEVGNTIPGCEPLSKSFGLAARHVANCPDALKSEEDINKVRRSCSFMCSPPHPEKDPPPRPICNGEDFSTCAE